MPNVMREAVKARVRDALSKRGLSLQREIAADFSPATVGTSA